MFGFFALFVEERSPGANVTPLQTLKPIGLALSNDAGGMFDTICIHELVVDICEDERQHHSKDTAMSDE